MLLVKVPTSLGAMGKNDGCEFAPSKICGSKKAFQIHVVAHDFDLTEKNIFQKARSVAAKKPFFIGGDHSITYSTFKGFAKSFREPSIVIFDAHADCSTYFRAVSHEDLNKALVHEKIAKPKNILIVGLRKVYPSERGFLKRTNLQTITSSQIRKNLAGAEQILKDFLSAQKNVYLSFDLDVFNPSDFFATGYPVKNGPAKNSVMRLLKTVLRSGKVRAADIVEYNPLLDKKGKSLRTAKIVFREISRAL